jgi:gluconate 5-dehydrogenase
VAHPHFDLSGRTALVTGGSRGLGVTIATALAEAGADVVVTSTKRDEIEASAARIGAG